VPDWPALAREIVTAEGPAVPERDEPGPDADRGRLASGWRLGRDFTHDLRYGLRTLGKAPAFTLLSALTLALGIGATTAMFSVVNAVLLKPLPFARPEELLRVWSSWADYPVGSVSEPELHDWRDRTSTLAGIAAYRYQTGSNLTTGAGGPVTVNVSLTSANFFEVLGAPSALGRTFLPDENGPGKTGVVVLSHGLWRRMFGADAGMIGRTLSLQGETVTVVGVMPAGFAYPNADVDLWQPMPLDRHKPRPRGNHYLSVVARLKPGQGLRQATADMEVVAGQLRAENPDAYPPGSGFTIGLRPLRAQLLGAVQPALLVLLGAVGLVLAIACANVASLMLARGTGRGREIAIRSALGAGRARLARQLLAESLLLAIVGGTAGVVGATLALPALLALAPAGLPRLSEARIDGPVLAVAATLTALTGVAFGLFPVWQSARVDANHLLKSGRTGAVGSARRPQKLLVVAETALAMVLLFGAGLLLRSFAKLIHEEPGFDPGRVATAWVSLPAARYPKPEDAARFFDRLRRALGDAPGAVSVAVVSNPPLSGWMNDNHITIEGYIPRGPGDRPDPEYREISPGYFRTLRIPVVRGREFADQDDGQHPRVAIISQSLALKYWGAEDPLGHRIRLSAEPGTKWFTIVGVVGDVKQTALSDPVLPTLYVPHLPGSSMMVLVRAAVDAQASLADISRSVRELDRGQAVSDARLMEDLFRESLSAQRFNLHLLGLFAALAVTLAGVGTFGVMRYVVDQRTAEIGIRMALGAGRGQVLGEVLREGLGLAVAGLAFGLLGAVVLARTITGLSSLLHGVTATDPLTMAAVGLLLLGVAVLACWAPARRATGVDPTVALRGE
jgi:putative ABC transport system permease protein